MAEERENVKRSREAIAGAEDEPASKRVKTEPQLDWYGPDEDSVSYGEELAANAEVFRILRGEAFAALEGPQQQEEGEEEEEVEEDEEEQVEEEEKLNEEQGDDDIEEEGEEEQDADLNDEEEEEFNAPTPTITHPITSTPLRPRTSASPLDFTTPLGTEAKRKQAQAVLERIGLDSTPVAPTSSSMTLDTTLSATPYQVPRSSSKITVGAALTRTPSQLLRNLPKEDALKDELLASEEEAVPAQTLKRTRSVSSVHESQSGPVKKKAKKVADCLVCGTETTKRCGQCRTAFYCCGEHQNADWAKHKLTCKPRK